MKEFFLFFSFITISKQTQVFTGEPPKHQLSTLLVSGKKSFQRVRTAFRQGVGRDSENAEKA